MPIRTPEGTAFPKAIIFDIGRVIVRLDVNRASESLASAAADANALVASQEPKGKQLWV